MSDPNSPNRFNEEAATFAVRGADAPDLEAGVAAIRNVLKTLPARPGVYRMQDARGDVLYVGKARALKNRVTNYTQVMRLSKRLQRMVAQTRSMTIVTTNNEAEALLLEAQLIKRFRPPYNVLLRDDKSFPFILLRRDHDFPRIQLHRGARKVKGDYFGPFAGAGQVRKTLNALQKLFLLRSCTDGFFNTRDRPCLLYQIRRCSAPCVDRITPEAYEELVDDARAFLMGKKTQVQAKLGAQMQAAAESLDFELAAILRDRLKALTFIQGSQAINAEGVGDADIFALACKGGVMGIQAFFIRGGQNWGHRSFFPAHTNDVSEDEVLSAFLMQFYEEVPPPRTIFVDRDLEEAALLAEALRNGPGTRWRWACRSAARAGGCWNRRRATQWKRSTGGWPRARPRRNCLQRSPTSSSCPRVPSGSRCTTTRTSRAPMRWVRWWWRGRKASRRTSIASSTSSGPRRSPATITG